LIKEIKDKQSIVLEKDIIELSEIIVHPDLSNKKMIGRTKTKGNRNVNFSIANKPRQNLGAEIGKKFKIKNVPTKVESLSFFIRLKRICLINTSLQSGMDTQSIFITEQTQDSIFIRLYSPTYGVKN